MATKITPQVKCLHVINPLSLACDLMCAGRSRGWHGIPEARKPPDDTNDKYPHAMNTKLSTFLAGVVVSVPILFGFLGVLLLVSDSDSPSMQVSFSEFILKKIAGALLVAVAYFSLRALRHWASAHEAGRK